jgi:hypothetical protein
VNKCMICKSQERSRCDVISESSISSKNFHSEFCCITLYIVNGQFRCCPHTTRKFFFLHKSENDVNHLLAGRVRV